MSDSLTDSWLKCTLQVSHHMSKPERVYVITQSLLGKSIFKYSKTAHTSKTAGWQRDGEIRLVHP